MKLLFYSTIFLFLINNLNSQPKLQILSGDTINWGKVKYINSPAESKLILKNTGKDTLYVLKLKPGCGCTSTKLKNKNIPPDSSETVEIQFNLPNVPGPTHKVIDIKTTDPDQPERIVHLLANVIFPIISIPQTLMITFPDMTSGIESKGEVTLINTTDEKIYIKELKHFPDNLTSNIKNDMVLEPNKEFKIKVSAIPQKTGFFNGSIKFKTTHPDVPRMEIPVRGNVMSSSIPK